MIGRLTTSEAEVWKGLLEITDRVSRGGRARPMYAKCGYAFLLQMAEFNTGSWGVHGKKVKGRTTKGESVVFQGK